MSNKEIVTSSAQHKKAHDASQHIEKSIRDNVPYLERVLIHYEPSVLAFRCYAFPLATPDGHCSEHFGEAPYFALVSVSLSDGESKKHEVVKNPFPDLPKAKGIRVAEWLASQKVVKVYMREEFHGKGPGYVLTNAGIETTYTEARSLSTALGEILNQHG